MSREVVSDVRGMCPRRPTWYSPSGTEDILTSKVWVVPAAKRNAIRPQLPIACESWRLNAHGIAYTVSYRNVEGLEILAGNKVKGVKSGRRVTISFLNERGNVNPRLAGYLISSPHSQIISTNTQSVYYCRRRPRLENVPISFLPLNPLGLHEVVEEVLQFHGFYENSSVTAVGCTRQEETHTQIRVLGE